MAIYLGKQEIGIVSEPTIKQQNINTYKFQDLSEIIQKGGELASNEEYVKAEIKLQEIYKSIIIGGENND